jgi:CHAT domain-containing protein
MRSIHGIHVRASEAVIDAPHPSTPLSARSSYHGWDSLNDAVKEVQKLDGFHDFYQTSSFDDVIAASMDRPIAYLTPGKDTGVGVIVRDGHAKAYSLPLLTRERVTQADEALWTAYQRRKMSPGEWEQALDENTRWLWKACMGTILRALRSAGSVVLIPSGSLTRMPFHAAWRPLVGAGRDYALDHLLITYAANARSLQFAADRRLSKGGPLLFLSGASTSPLGGLPALNDEVEGVQRHFPQADLLWPSTNKEILNGMRDATIMHCACHGVASPKQPLNSALLHAHGRLRVRDLINLREPSAVSLAVLSACETAVAGDEMPDEVVGLPMAFTYCGVRGVIGSTWAVPDSSTALLITQFYRLWLQDDVPLSAAEALRRAQQWLRDSTNGEKLLANPNARSLQVPLSGVARTFWESGNSHGSIRSWAGFSYFGAV